MISAKQIGCNILGRNLVKIWSVEHVGPTCFWYLSKEPSFRHQKINTKISYVLWPGQTCKNKTRYLETIEKNKSINFRMKIRVKCFKYAIKMIVRIQRF